MKAKLLGWGKQKGADHGYPKFAKQSKIPSGVKSSVESKGVTQHKFLKKNDANDKHRIKEVKIWKFDDAPEELKEKILEKNREINLDSDFWADYDGLIYDKKSGLADYDVFKNYSKKYYDLDRGQYIQFPDLEINDESKLLKMLGLPESINKKISDIGFDSERERNTKIVFRDLLSNTIDTDGTYDDYTKYIDNDDKSEMLTKKQFEDLQRATTKWDDLMHDAWVNLRDNYEYQYSDEGVKETLTANDYDFDEYGNIA